MTSLSETPRSIYYQAFTRDGYKCVFCDRDILDSFDSFAGSHLDHLKPRKTGGSCDDLLNRVTACAVCNNIKGAFDPSPDGPVTTETFEQAIAVARKYIHDKREGKLSCSYHRDYEYWLKEAGRR